MAVSGPHVEQYASAHHAVSNYHKKYFRTQKSGKTAEFGSEIARIRIRQIRNSKVPIPLTCQEFWVRSNQVRFSELKINSGQIMAQVRAAI